MRVLQNCWVLATLLLCNVTVAQQPQSINVALKTSFNAAPYLVELLETAALENSTSYFPLLDRIAEGIFSDVSTDQEFYQKFLDVLREDGHLSSPDSLSSFKYALALRTAAPRIEAHFQYYKSSVEPKMMAAQDAACPVWVSMDGQQYCSPTLERAQQPVDIDDEGSELPFDRVLGQSADGVPSVLYADITHPLFGQFHETISRTAREGKTTYKLRYRPSTGSDDRPLYVSGYGAELVLKRTDYIVIDDRDAEKAETKEAEDPDDKIKPDFKPLTTSELNGLGLKAASFILSQSNPMDVLLDVTGHFPAYSAQIANHNTSLEFVSEHMANRDILLPAGYNVIWMNGLQLGKRQIDPHLLLDTLKKERKLIGQLRDIGLTSNEAIDLLSYETLAQAQAGDESVRYHWTDNEESAPVIMWMNKLEDDKRYASWPKTLQMVLQRVYPGQLPQVRRDIHNLIVPIDVGNIHDLDLVVNALQGLVKRLIPLQIGLLPVGKSERAEQVSKLSYYFLNTYGISGLMGFYQNIIQSKNGLAGLQTSFEATIKDREARKNRTVLDYSGVLTSDNIEKQIAALQTYQQRLGLDEATILINGVAVPRDENWFEEVSTRLTTDLRQIQLGVYQSQIPEDTWVPGIFLEGAIHRRNKLVIPNDLKSIRISAVADLVSDFPETFASLPRVSGGEASLLSDRVHILVSGDFETVEGRSLAREALKFHSKHPETELLFVHSSQTHREGSKTAAKLFNAASKADHTAVLIGEIFDDKDQDSSELEAINDDAASFWTQQEDFVKQAGLYIGKCGLWLNGRTIGPIEEPFMEYDFEALLDFERKHRIAPVTTAITGLGLENKFQKPLDFAKITSIVARSLKSDIPEGMHESAPPIRMNHFNKWKSEHSTINVASTAETTIQIVAVIDPASEVTQPWVPILKTLSELEGIDVKIFLNPQNKLEELPVKRFYSAVLDSAPTFDADGTLVSPKASFANVPQKTLFNLGMIVPPAWLVAPKESIYDLDNIKLSSVPDGANVDAVYELEHILIEGHARDITKGIPPRGAQLLLGTHETPHFADTIIMANLGYFQFKANPGYWDISLKPGRSSKIFIIDSVGSRGYAPQPGDETTSVALLSFQGVTLYPRLSRKAGMEDEDVLETSAKPAAMDYIGKGASFAQSALSSLGFKKSGSNKNADVNIFSVASGHLYERMLNIMMVSVMRNTKHTVKFWFIEQFLSPSFKKSVPTLAKHYGFDFEMVTYKWPHWLRGQKEKQREIWGYKILFLDVLFPLNLDKVIFVDADQIVRTDMMNLNKVDLEGAPYGFTPMCDSRTEMEGYRFWKQGYWKNFLEGKPYHISALYVVDLKKFRELAAGDRLRGQYHQLSADPASLSNLDQDLPNHMQHVLPIHSLSQEWLWCETWCSDESLSVAKTIDLCNNPETKEPKLDRARRQVPEWTEYDDEIASVLKAAKQSRSSYADVQEQEQKSAAQEAGRGTASVVSSTDDRHKRDEL